MQIRKFGNTIIIISLLLTFILLSGCGGETKQINTEPYETVGGEEIDLTKLLSVVNDCVVGHCGSEYILTPFV